MKDRIFYLFGEKLELSRTLCRRLGNLKKNYVRSDLRTTQNIFDTFYLEMRLKDGDDNFLWTAQKWTIKNRTHLKKKYTRKLYMTVNFF